MLAAGTVIHVREGHEIFAEGMPTDSFYKVLGGVVRVCRFLGDGRRQIEAFHVPGEVFGFEIDAERNLSAEAVNDCTLVCYRRRSVEQMAQKDQAVSRQLLHHVLQNLKQAQDHALLLGRRGAVEKVAAFLLAWSRHGTDRRDFTLAMTRQDIADYLGLTIETVSRSLTQMERDGVIGIPNTRAIHLSNVATLEKLAA